MNEQQRNEFRQKFKVFDEHGNCDHEMLDIAARESHRMRNDAQMEKALELTSAGWVPFLHEGHSPHPFTGQVDVMSWFWRRPPRRPNSKGMVFRSTDQAFNHMLKMRGEPPINLP